MRIFALINIPQQKGAHHFQFHRIMWRENKWTGILEYIEYIKQEENFTKINNNTNTNALLDILYLFHTYDNYNNIECCLFFHYSCIRYVNIIIITIEWKIAFVVGLVLAFYMCMEGFISSWIIIKRTCMPFFR